MPLTKISKTTAMFIFLILILIIGSIILFFYQRSPEFFLNVPKQENMKLTSSAFEAGQLIPKKYTCDGENVSPPLVIEDIPDETKSLVLIVDDPDAPMGTWNHWLVWNLDPKIREIKENSVPEKAVLGTNDFGKLEYGGPCPPSGIHRYFFKIYALDTLLDLPVAAKKNTLVKVMENHILDQGELIGSYGH